MEFLYSFHIFLFLMCIILRMQLRAATKFGNSGAFKEEKSDFFFMIDIVTR